MSSRTDNILKNLKYGSIGQVIAIIFSFVTRLIFVRTLSIEYLGVNGLFSNILNIINLAEAGFGAAIVYKLYEPLASKNQDRIATLMAIYKKIYRIIGLIVFLLGLSLMPFLTTLLPETGDIQNIQLIYFILILNSALPYLFSYNLNLMVADQKEYIIGFYNSIFAVILNVLKIAFLLLTRNFIVYLIIEASVALSRNAMLSQRAKKMHPYLKTTLPGKLDQTERRELLRNVRAMMLHKAGGIIVLGTDNILLAAFANIAIVGFYSNYLLIISGISIFINIFFRSVTASVGNLIANKSREELPAYFFVINFLGFWVVAFCSISLWILFDPFISLWLGTDFLLPPTLVGLIVLNFYLLGMRNSVLLFRDTLGLFWQERHKAVLEAFLNLFLSVVLGLRFGAEGVFIGTALSTLLVCFWIEPFNVFKNGFKESPLPYFGKYLLYGGLGFTALMTVSYLGGLVDSTTFLGFALLSVITLLGINALFLLFFHRTREFKFLKDVLSSRIKLKTDRAS